MLRHTATFWLQTGASKEHWLKFNDTNLHHFYSHQQCDIVQIDACSCKVAALMEPVTKLLRRHDEVSLICACFLDTFRVTGKNVAPRPEP
jgi:hypothetical protein